MTKQFTIGLVFYKIVFLNRDDNHWSIRMIPIIKHWIPVEFPDSKNKRGEMAHENFDKMMELVTKEVKTNYVSSERLTIYK